MSVIEKWIRQKVNTDKLSTSQVATSDDVKGIHTIKVNYIPEHECGYTTTSAYVGFDHCFYIKYENHGISEDYKYEHHTKYMDIDFTGTISVYRWAGEKSVLEANQNPEEHTYNESFLAQCQHLQDFDINLSGNSECICAQLGTAVYYEAPSDEDSCLIIGIAGQTYVDLYLDTVRDHDSPPFIFIGRSNLVKCKRVGSVEINGIRLLPESGFVYDVNQEKLTTLTDRNLIDPDYTLQG